MHISVFRSSLLVTSTCMVLAACTPTPRPSLPAPLAGAEKTESVTQNQENNTTESTNVLFHDTPGVNPITRANLPDMLAADNIQLPDKKMALAMNGIPLPAFINEVLGNRLELDFVLDSKLQSAKDLVTLRIEQEKTAQEVFELTLEVLDTYGVKVIEKNGYLSVAPASTVDSTEPPLLISGRALPNVPVTHRPVFQVLELSAVAVNDVSQWLRQVFRNENLTITDNFRRNSIILQGDARVVERASKIVAVFDQPLMRGKYSVRVTPEFWQADDLSERLNKVLESEGYSVSNDPGRGSIITLPIQRNNSLIVFASDRNILRHVQEWIEELDVPGIDRDKPSFFSYTVQNTSASDLVETLKEFIGNMQPNLQNSSGAAGNVPNAPQQTNNSLGAGQLVADENRNMLLYYGQTAEWQQLQPMIKSMDKPGKMTLIEVTIAEVVVTDKSQFGIEWAAIGGVDDLASAFGTSLGVGSGGFSFTLESAGQTRAVLNALASDDKATIVSTPRILVSSGQQASIDVGTEIPIVTQQSQGDIISDGESQIIQQVRSRSTGVQMTVTPVVYGNNLIDLSISQSVSEALGESLTPQVNNRSVNTRVRVKDGGSVVIGGMMQTSLTEGEQRVPLLGDIPLVGHLFKSQSETKVTTELIILVVPYVIENEHQATSITQQFKDALELIEKN